MRHKGVKKEQTLQKILEATGRGFKKNGYAGIGVDALSKAAGATSGAFYSHFGSKAGAFESVLKTGLDEVIEGIPKFQKDYGENWVKEFAEYYLGKTHRNDLECGCAMATLTPEVVRTEKKVHGIYEKKMTVITDLIANGLAGKTEKDRLTKAWSLLGVLIGGINIARAMKSTKLSEEIATAIKSAAIEAAGPTK